MRTLLIRIVALLLAPALSNAFIAASWTIPTAEAAEVGGVAEEPESGAAGKKSAVVDVRTVLERGRRAGKLPEGVTIRVAACLGEPKDNSVDGLVEVWEFTSDRVYRIDPQAENNRDVAARVDSRPFDSKELCKLLLDGKAVEIQARGGTGPETLLVGSQFQRGSRSIEVIRKGETILDLHETNGPAFVAYPESDARAFGALYEKLSAQVRSLFKSPAGK